jgi:hypothetical protein
MSYLCCEILELIHDNDELYRRVTKDQIKENGTVSSGAFTNTGGTDDMSVDLGRLTSIEETSSFKGLIFGVASFHAGHARQYEQLVFHDPDHEYDNYAHTTVKGRKSSTRRKYLAKGAIVRFNPFGTKEKG